MGQIRSLIAGGLLLACLNAVSATSALSEASSVCSFAYELRQVVRAGSATQSVLNPETALSIATALSAELGTMDNVNAGTALAEVSTAIAGIPSSVEIAERNGVDPGAALYQALTRNSTTLEQVEEMFGCRNAVAHGPGIQTPTPGPATKTPSLEPSSGGSSSIPVPENWPRFALLILAAILGAWMLAKRGDRSARKICRTATQLVSGKNCTVTHIVDITRSGAKVEASQLKTNGAWIRLFFCGHEVEGKFVWRNEYYGGIRFRSKISKKTLEDVILKSHLALADSGLEGKASPCFSVGCHLNCPRHFPTALSVERSANEASKS